MLSLPSRCRVAGVASVERGIIEMGKPICRAYRPPGAQNFPEAVKNGVINEIYRVFPQNILTIRRESLILCEQGGNH